MGSTYVIAWKSELKSSFGRGKKLFTREEAESLAKELNQDYPDFVHEALNLNPGEAPSGETSTVTDAGENIVNVEFSGSCSTIGQESTNAEVA